MDESRKEGVLKWIQSEKSGMNVCLYSWIHCFVDRRYNDSLIVAFNGLL